MDLTVVMHEKINKIAFTGSLKARLVQMKDKITKAHDILF